MTSPDYQFPPPGTTNPRLHLDTCWLGLRRPLAAEVVDSLSEANEWRCVRQQRPNRRHPKSKWALVLQQPTQECLALLAGQSDVLHWVRRADVALDILTADADEAQAVQTALMRSVIQPHHGRRMCRIEQNSYYLADHGTTNRNAIIYPKQLADGWRCRFEMRFVSPSACRAVGMHTVADLTMETMEEAFCRAFRLRQITNPVRMRKAAQRLYDHHPHKGALRHALKIQLGLDAMPDWDALPLQWLREWLPGIVEEWTREIPVGALVKCEKLPAPPPPNKPQAHMAQQQMPC